MAQDYRADSRTYPFERDEHRSPLPEQMAHSGTEYGRSVAHRSSGRRDHDRGSYRARSRRSSYDEMSMWPVLVAGGLGALAIWMMMIGSRTNRSYQFGGRDRIRRAQNAYDSDRRRSGERSHDSSALGHVGSSTSLQPGGTTPGSSPAIGAGSVGTGGGSTGGAATGSRTAM